MKIVNRKSTSLGMATIIPAALILNLLVFVNTASAQWTQTLGWGGAGHGKREIRSDPNDSQKKNTISWLGNEYQKRQPNELLSVSELAPDSCLPNPVFQRLINDLLQTEVDRIQRCKAGQDSMRSSNDYN